jgi:hypothetical protein
LGRKWELKDGIKKAGGGGGKDEDTQEVTLLNLKREFATKLGIFL